MATSVHRAQQRRTRGEARARIVAAAEELLRSRRVRELSIEDLMDAAGMTRTVFYRHFDDLFDLVIQVSDPAFDELLQRQAEAVAGSTDLPVAVRRSLEPLVEHFSSHGPLMRAVIDATAFDDGAERVFRHKVAQFAELTAKQADVNDAAAREAIRALVLMNVGYLIDRFGDGDAVAETDQRVAVDALTTVWLGVIDALIRARA